MSEIASLLSSLSVEMSDRDVARRFEGDLLEVTIENSLHLPDAATFVLWDPGFLWIDNAKLLGMSIKVSTQPSARISKQRIFDGEIVEVEPSLIAGEHRLVVRAFDRMHRLARVRHTRSFANVTDEELL
jgi:hypothetical protein